MQLKGKKVLVTGATGFIGGHLTEALIKAGAKVHCTFRSLKNNSYLEKNKLQKKVKLIRCDLADAAQVRKLLRQNEFAYIFHLAAKLRPKNFYEAYINNTLTAVNILENAKTLRNIKGVFFASSSRSKIGELSAKTLEQLFVRPYDLSKTISDLIVQAYIKKDKMPIVLIRYGNVFGPGDDLVKPLRLTADIIRHLKIGRPFKPGDPKAIVDLIYVKDVTRAFVSRAHGRRKIVPGIVDLKPMIRCSVLEWTQKIATIVKRGKASSLLEKALMATYNWQT